MFSGAALPALVLALVASVLLCGAAAVTQGRVGVPSSSDSAWTTVPRDHPLNAGADLCEVDVVTELSDEEFQERYFTKKPFLWRGAACAWPAMSAWTKDFFRELSVQGDANVSVGTSNYIHGDAAQSGGWKQPLHELIDGLGKQRWNGSDTQEYAFDRRGFFESQRDVLRPMTRFPATFAPLLRRHPRGEHMFMDKAVAQATRRSLLPLSGPPMPPHSHCDMSRDIGRAVRDISDSPRGDDREFEVGQYYFAVGATGTGLRLHAHNPAWNALLVGRKRWVLYEPARLPGIHSSVSTGIGHWYTHIRPALNADHAGTGPASSELPIECTQEAGDVMYLPEGWNHGTLNVGDTVAIAWQRKHPATAEFVAVLEAREALGQGDLCDDFLQQEEGLSLSMLSGGPAAGRRISRKKGRKACRAVSRGIQSLSKHIKEFHWHEEALQLYASLHASLHQFNASLITSEHLLRMAPRNIDVLNNRAAVLSNAAMQWLSHLLQLLQGPPERHPKAFDANEDLCTACDRLAAAVSTYSESLSVLQCPHNAAACAHHPLVADAMQHLQPLFEECRKFRREALGHGWEQQSSEL